MNELPRGSMDEKGKWIDDTYWRAIYIWRHKRWKRNSGSDRDRERDRWIDIYREK